MDNKIVWIFLFVLVAIVVIVVSVIIYKKHISKNSEFETTDEKECCVSTFVNLVNTPLTFTINKQTSFTISEYCVHNEIVCRGDFVEMRYDNFDGKKSYYSVQLLSLLPNKVIYGSYSGISSSNSSVNVSIENRSQSRILVIERTVEGRRFARDALSPGSAIDNLVVPNLTTLEIVLASDENTPKSVIKVTKINNKIIYT